MVSYKELGLVNTREMFKKAVAGGYAIPAFNFNNMEQLQAIIQASAETKSPVILQVSKGARNYANQTLLRYMAEGAVEYAKELGWEHPQIVLHLDHGDSFELCKSCVDMGFSSVMIDASSLPYEENIALTKKVVDYAHQYDVTVEAELGVLAGVEDEVSAEESHYTRPEEVIDFATRTGCDSLPAPAATASPSPSAPVTAPTSSSPSSAPAIPRRAAWFPRRSLSTSCTRLRRSSPASRSFSTVLPPFPRSMSTSSTPTAESCRMPSVSPRSSSARPPRAPSARSTSTPTAVWR